MTFTPYSIVREWQLNHVLFIAARRDFSRFGIDRLRQAVTAVTRGVRAAAARKTFRARGASHTMRIRVIDGADTAAFGLRR